MPSFRGSPWPRNWTCVFYVSCIAGGFFTTSATWEAPNTHKWWQSNNSRYLLTNTIIWQRGWQWKEKNKGGKCRTVLTFTKKFWVKTDPHSYKSIIKPRSKELYLHESKGTCARIRKCRIVLTSFFRAEQEHVTGVITMGWTRHPSHFGGRSRAILSSCPWASALWQAWHPRSLPWTASGSEWSSWPSSHLTALLTPCELCAQSLWSPQSYTSVNPLAPFRLKQYSSWNTTTIHSCLINEHQRSFQISTQEASQSMLLNMMNVQWCQNNFIISLCFCFWKSSNFCSQSKENFRLFPFFASGSTETCFWTTRKGIKICCLDLWSAQVVTHSLSVELSLGWEHPILCIQMTAESLSVEVVLWIFLLI